MTTKSNSAFPLILAKPSEILTISKIEAPPRDQKLFEEQGLTPNTLIQFIKKLEDDTHVLMYNGKTIHLAAKLARMLRVTLCSVREKSSACSFCLHKGSCHG